MYVKYFLVGKTSAKFCVFNNATRTIMSMNAIMFKNNDLKHW